MTTGEGGSPGSLAQADYENFTRTDGTELWERVDAAHRRFTQLVSRVDPAAPVADSDWTAHEVAAHVLSVLDRYTERDLRRRDGLADDSAGVTAMNDAQMRLVRPPLLGGGRRHDRAPDRPDQGAPPALAGPRRALPVPL